jgi:CDP-diacylglycerol--glycerol-3-phosphate 3-phosphatidyltransferase
MIRIITFISLSRILAALLIICAYFIGPLWPIILCCLLWSAVSDFLDGYLARRYKICSPFGAWLDHLTDKIVIATALMVLSFATLTPLYHLCCVFIINRELIVLGLRSYPSIESLEANPIKVNMLGKIKTALQFISLLLLVTDQWLALNGGSIYSIHTFGLVGLLGATVMAYISLISYWRGFKKQVMSSWSQRTLH